MDSVELRHGAATDVGRVRRVNEDSLLAASPVFAVADGMGGHHGGDVASRTAVGALAGLAGTVLDRPTAAEAIRRALGEAQRLIIEYARAQSEGGADRWYAGTTVVVALLTYDEAGPGWLVANLGDSRAYRLHEGAVHQVTVDHSLVQELLDAGVITPEEAAFHPERHVVTRALGGPDDVGPDLFWVPVDQADRLLLCSDGVTGMLRDERIAELLGGADPGEAATRIVAAAVDAGGLDNATAVVVDVVGWAP